MEKSIPYSHSEQTATVCAFDSTAVQEFSSEMTLADYYPEIYKVISLGAKALPDSKYISNTNLELGGTVLFTLIYIGEDKALQSQSFSMEYSQSFPLGAFNGGSRDIFISSEAQMPQVRVLSPRSVSLKAQIKSRAFADKREDCTFRASLGDSQSLTPKMRRSLERLDKDLFTFQRAYSFITDTLTKKEPSPEGALPVLCRGEMMISEAEAKEGSIDIRGQVCFSYTILTKEGVYERRASAIPFEKNVRCDGAGSDTQVCAVGRIASAGAKCEGGEIELSAEYDMDIVTSTPKPLTVTEDIYSKSYPIETESRETDIISASFAKNSVITVSKDAPRKAEGAAGECIIDAIATPKIEKAQVKDSKVYIIGSCPVKLYIASEGEIKSEELTLPIEAQYPAEQYLTGEGIWHFNITGAVSDCRLEADKLSVKCTLGICALAYGKEKCAPIVSCTVEDNARDESESEILVYYPEKGKRIWDIAKECSASLTEAERINKIDRRSLSDGTPIIFR